MTTDAALDDQVDQWSREARDADLETWPEDTESDAATVVLRVETAVGEIMHGDAVGRLEGTPGMEPLPLATTAVTHDCEGNDFDAEPFDIPPDPDDDED